MRVLVFGGGGQVGFDLARARWPEGFALRSLDRAEADITEPAAIAAALAAEPPDLVVNLAAYTAVDRAESESERAWAVNCAGAGNVARAASTRGVPLVHISTDYVFDGTKSGPYREEDPVNPLGQYGASKEAGERAVREAAPRHVILRTQWVYGVAGANFVKTMLRLGRERDVVRVVADQWGGPTAAADLARAIVAIAQQIAAGSVAWGTYHYAGAGAVSWHGFAEAIFDLAAPYLGRRPRLERVATADYPTPARRPLNSVLDCEKIRRDFGITPRPWRQSLEAMLGEYFASETVRR
ncbi:MAG TPA: dTDP-4-dehydrorhamnose reductase [Stellaceae bacterium]|nr:dTDP-4-dehydrorhamnose reductase [Stellaceae bacterium]